MFRFVLLVVAISLISSMDVGNLLLHLESMARPLYFMTEKRMVDSDDFATDRGQESMETNLNKRSDGECRCRIGQNREMGNGYSKWTRHS